MQERLRILEQEFFNLTEKFHKYAELADAQRTMMLCMDEFIMQIRDALENQQRRIDHLQSRILHLESTWD